MRKTRLFSILALLLMAATGAVAQTETLLTTITATGTEQASYSTANVATVSYSNLPNCSSSYLANWGWWGYGWSATVTAAEGYTITKCKFYDDADRTATDSKAPFVVETTEEDKTPRINGTPIDGGNMWSKGIKKIEVYGYANAPAAAGYSITLAEGTEDADKWTIEPNTGLNGGETVTVTYSGEKKVKSVKAVKKEVGPEVTTFSELQAVLSAGKDVKLMNDIVCTAEIEITSDGALTIDGNGKTLSTTSAIRAFKVGSSATVAFKNLTLTGFVSGGGPAINNNGGTIVLDGCTISNCHVNNGQGGGAIENKGSGKLYAINTTFSGNYSGEIGGAINNNGSSLYMSGCTFTNNYTTSSNAFYGGAIGINRGNEVRLINCVFSGNKYGTNTGTNDIGVFFNPTNYTIAGCTGATIAPRVGDITTNASGTATLDYSDLSNISFTYSVPVTVTWNKDDITGSGNSFTKDGVTINVGRYIDFDYKEFVGGGTFTTTLGNFTKIEVSARRFRETGTGWSGNSGKMTWTGNASSSVSFSGDIIGSSDTKFVFTIEPKN